MFASIDQAVATIHHGGMVIVIDDEDRENEGDLIMAAEKVTAEALAFFVRHTSGLICVPMLGQDLERLHIPMMVSRNEDPKGTAYAVSVDAVEGTTTGISASDRARTIQVLAARNSTPNELRRPGHVFPLRYEPGGILRRRGHTEAAVDLVRLAGLRPVGVIAELVNRDGTMARLADLQRFSAQYSLPIIPIADIVSYRRSREPPVERAAEARLPTPYGVWRAIGYRGAHDQTDSLALVYGNPEARADLVVARMHSECLTGEAHRSLRCDCGAQLDVAMEQIADHGEGVIVYLRGHEGRGIGLARKLEAYALQDLGHDTVEANYALGLPADARDYTMGAMIFADLGLSTLRLLTNNPAKQTALVDFGLTVERAPIEIPPNSANARYLAAKAQRMGHLLSGYATATSMGVGRISPRRQVAAARTERSQRGLAMAPPPHTDPFSEAF